MRYKAFISYSHAADGKLAPAIQHALHRIAKPWYKLRTMRVFRDQTNLATNPGLWSSIESALSDTEFFVYLASPTAAQSPWVQKEISWWLKNRSYQSFLILLTDGEIAWDNANQDLDWKVTTALPQQASKVFAEEPLYTDLRWARSVDQLSIRHAQFRTGLLNVAATLLKRDKDELDGDDVRQYRRTRRIAWSGAITLAVLFVGALLAAYFATQQSMLATARALSAQSEAVLPTNPELALLLAREALKYNQDDQAEFALRQAFVRNPQRMIHHSPSAQWFTARFVGSNAIIADDGDKPSIVWDVNTGQRVTELPAGNVSRELIVSDSADPPVLAIPAPDGASFTLYNVKTGQAVASLPGTDAKISRDGKILTALQGDQIKQWALPALQQLDVKASLPEKYVVHNVNDDGSLLLLTEDGGFSEGSVVHAISGQTLATIPKRVFREGESFSPNGRLVVTQHNEEGTVELWNAQSGSLVRAFENTELGWISYVAFSPDSKMFVAGDRSGYLQAWNLDPARHMVNDEQVLMVKSQGTEILSIKFSADSQSMLTLAANGTADLWDTANMRTLVTLGGKGDEALHIAFAPDSRHFLTTHTDGTVRVWDRQMWHPARTVPATQAIIGDDANFVLSAENAPVQLWNATDGQLKATLQQSPADIECMALSTAKSLVAIAPSEGVVRLWNAQTGATALQLGPPSAQTTALAFDSTGTQLATGSGNGTVRFWSTSDGKLLTEWAATENEVGPQNQVRRILFHPDGERVMIAAGVWARVRERKSGKELWQTQVSEDGWAHGLALNADGTLLIITTDTNPQIWDLTSYKQVQTLEGHSDDVYSAAFSREGRWMLTGSGYMRNREPPEDSNAIFLWDAKTGRQLLSYLSAGLPVEAVSFANDGRTILAFADVRARRYECDVCVPLPELLDLVSARTSRELSADERARYLSEATLLGWLMNRLASG